MYGILFSNFWLLFIASFIETGEVENEEDAKLIYSNVMIVSVVLGILIVPVVGKLSDKYSPKILLPLAFLVRFIGIVMFMFIKNPKSIYAYCVSIFLVMGTAMENVLVDCLLLRNAEREIRGVLYGTAVACGYIGQLIFSLCGGILFDRIGPYMPFVFVGSLDFVFFFVVSLLGCCNIIKNDILEREVQRRLNSNQ